MATYGERLVRVDFDTPSIPEVGEIKRRCAELIDLIVNMEAPECPSPPNGASYSTNHHWSAYDMMQNDKREAIRSIAHASMMGVKAATQWKSDGTPY